MHVDSRAYGQRLHKMVEIQAKRTPDRPALISEERVLTYRMLDEEANRLARLLRQNGAGAGKIVGVALERSIDQVVSTCAVLKSGAAYMPLEPGHPQERQAAMLEDALPAAIVTQSTLRDRLPAGDVPVVCLDRSARTVSLLAPDRLPEEEVAGAHAYVIFTSGSSGRPKGVLNTHRGICNHLQWMREKYPLGDSDVVIHKTPLTFDVSVWEVFWPLVCGAALFVAQPEGHKDPAYLSEAILTHGVNTAHFVPSMLRMFLDEASREAVAQLHRIICSGEALSPDLVERCHQVSEARLLNLYGPTEAAVHVTGYECAHRQSLRSIPIGRPVANTSIYLVDETQAQVPAGEVGEIWIGGVQVAEGYLNRPDLTASSFVNDPFSSEPGSRVYRTGDLGRLLPDGNIDFLGRRDDQVKVNGTRIELGEVEVALRAHPGVQEAAVAVQEDRERRKRLVAFVVSRRSRPLSHRDLLVSARESLPESMLPSAVVQVDRLPLTSSGKLDRHALSVLVQHQLSPLEVQSSHCQSPAVLKVAKLFADVLGLGSVVTDCSFFELGGDSLLAVHILAGIREEYGVTLPLRALFERPTPASLAEAIEEAIIAQIEGEGGMEAAAWVPETKEG